MMLMSVSHHLVQTMLHVTGRLCDTDIDYCLLASCQNGGTCEDGANNYTCHCVTGQLIALANTFID